MSASKFASGTLIARTAWYQEREIGGPARRKIALALFEGEVRYADGERGDYIGPETIEIDNPALPYRGTCIILLKDGTESHQTFDERMTETDCAGRMIGIGTWKLINGTGRFRELRGGGNMTWVIENDEWRAEFSGNVGPQVG